VGPGAGWIARQEWWIKPTMLSLLIPISGLVSRMINTWLEIIGVNEDQYVSGAMRQLGGIAGVAAVVGSFFVPAGSVGRLGSLSFGGRGSGGGGGGTAPDWALSPPGGGGGAAVPPGGGAPAGGGVPSFSLPAGGVSSSGAGGGAAAAGAAGAGAPGGVAGPSSGGGTPGGPGFGPAAGPGLGQRAARWAGDRAANLPGQLAYGAVRGFGYAVAMAATQRNPATGEVMVDPSPAINRVAGPLARYAGHYTDRGVERLTSRAGRPVRIEERWGFDDHSWAREA
jgi:hypothetical protein